MLLRERLTRAYFNAVYNPLYDSTTARLSKYAEAQETLVQNLRIDAGQRILCAGLGTGNEMTRLRAHQPVLDLVGVDLSPTALVSAGRKSSGYAGTTSLARMDVERLAFDARTFDRVLCYHVLDFVATPELVVSELMRVLKPGGRFVISFPAGAEGAGLGASLLSHNLQGSAAQSCNRAARFARTMLTGLVYLPLTLRRRPTTYTSSDLETLLRSHGAVDLTIASDPVYRDHIASGLKEKGEVTDAT